MRKRNMKKMTAWRIAPAHLFWNFSGHGRPRPVEWFPNMTSKGFQATGGTDLPNSAKPWFWRLLGPRTAQTTQMARGPHFRVISSPGQPSPPKAPQELILEALRATCRQLHPKYAKDWLQKLFGWRQSKDTANEKWRYHKFPELLKQWVPDYALTYLHTLLLTYYLAYLFTYLLTYTSTSLLIDLFTYLLT